MAFVHKLINGILDFTELLDPLKLRISNINKRSSITLLVPLIKNNCTASIVFYGTSSLPLIKLCIIIIVIIIIFYSLEIYNSSKCI